MITMHNWEYRKPEPNLDMLDVNSIFQREPELLKAIPALCTLCQCRSDIAPLEFDKAPAITHKEYFAEAVAIIEQHIREGKSILIWGDYDVDGMTSTAAMYFGLELAGAKVCWAIPNRLEQGYGIDVSVISSKVAPGALVITVDNGISDIVAIDCLIEKGYKVIVTDHHIPTPELPKTVIVNPKVFATSDEDIYMAPGVFVAAMLVRILVRKMFSEDVNRKWIPYYVDRFCYPLIMMGIISDVIPLNPTMRRHVLWGLSELSVTTHSGLRALLEMCGAKRNQNLTSTFMAYSVIPKLNAAGRMGSPEKGVALLLLREDASANHTTALLAANDLKYLNSDRKIIENQICLEAFGMAEEQLKKYPHSIILFKEGWHSGVLGIVAARVAEQFYRPTIILTNEGQLIKGSGRSVGDFDLHGALKLCAEDLSGFGGHTAAAGVQLEKQHLAGFMQKFDAAAKTANISPVSTILIDSDITLPQIYDVRLSLFLENVEPFGSGNGELVFRLPNVKVLSSNERRDVLNLIIQDADGHTMMISKYRPPEEYKKCLNETIDVLLSPMPVYFSGTTSVEWRIQSIKKV